MPGTWIDAMLSYVLTCAILFLSTLTRSTLGFGDAVVAMPLLTLVLGIHTAAPFVALVATAITVMILWSDWQVVDVKATWRVVLAVLLGIAVHAVRQCGPDSDWHHLVPAGVCLLNRPEKGRGYAYR
jgi:uncharacterized membrane protein YfcA